MVSNWIHSESSPQFIPLPDPNNPGGSTRTYLDLKVDITSPRHGDRRTDPNLTVTGTVKCERVTLINGGEVARTNAMNQVQKVEIKLGNSSLRLATRKGSNNSWSQWSFSGKSSSYGSLKITARATATNTTSSDSATITIDDIVKPIILFSSTSSTVTQPPYTATIKGRASDVGSGVKRVEWRLNDSGVFKLATKDTSNWSRWRIAHNLPGLDTYKFTIRAIDNANNVSNALTTFVTAKDATKPTLIVQTPPEDHRVVIEDESITIPLTGTASDTQTGVEVVEWRVDQGTFQPAETTNNWATWNANVTLSKPGDYIVEVRARDRANNQTLPVKRQVIVTTSFKPNDPLDVVSPTVYLEDLLKFVHDRVKTAEGSDEAVTPQHLTESFYQPFEPLIGQAFRHLVKQPVHQVRICIEVLRRHLAKLGKALPTKAELQYRRLAYQSLLQQFGVSTEELRLARAADPTIRSALAERLGFALDGSRPDPLDQLLLAPAQLTETNLEKLFGLLDTTHDLAGLAIAPEPQLLLWQLEYLRSRWQQQDANTERPIIDPDLFVAEDFQSQTPDSVAFTLWQARQRQVGDRLDQLRAAQKAAQASRTPLESFDLLVSDAVVPVATLIALAETYRQGEEIAPQLAEIQLEIQAFLALMQLRELAQVDRLLDEEWEIVFAILVQVWKLQQYAAWRTEEQQSGLILSPQEFALLGNPVVLPAERASQTARKRWQDSLKARIEQEQTIIQAFAAAVSAAEAAALPMLRDGLIATIDPERALADVANQLSRELLIDMQNGGDQKTTRVELAISAVQEVLFAVRTERFAAGHPAADWVLNRIPSQYGEAEFDEEIQWMGAYATWRAAMFVFGYPANYLLPNLRSEADQSPEFKILVNQLRSESRLTPDRARTLANEYFGLNRSDSPSQRLQTEVLNPAGVSFSAKAFLPSDQVTEVQLATRHENFKLLFEKAQYKRLQDIPSVVVEAGYAVPLLLALYLQRAGQYVAALDWCQLAYAHNLPAGQRKVYAGLTLEETNENRFDRALDWLLDDFNPHTIANTRSYAYTHYTVSLLVSCVLDFADTEFTRDSNEAIAKARSLYLTALELLDSPDMQLGEVDSPFPPNPMIVGLRLHAETNLHKIRSGRNIAGLERQAQFESANNSSFSGLATINSGAIQLAAPPQPTPYRYSVLIAQAKELVAIAQQIEATFLSTLEKQDAEAYSLLKARQDIQLSYAGVKLQDLRVQESQKEVELAKLQQNQSQFRVGHFQGLLNEGLSGKEKTAIGFMIAAAALHTSASVLSASGAVINTAVAVATFGLFGGKAADSAAQAASSLAAASSTTASILQTYASYERRAQEWRFQQQLAAHDVRIGQQQVAIARGRVGLARQEQTISKLQSDQAEDTLDFLVTKFTNRELYDWMSRVLERIYSYFLQQATAMARLAEAQLAFERQATPPAFIQSDYWQVIEEDGSASSDRRGLTGSVRLLQDITKLDQYAFETNQRKLQLTQTLSLAQLAPIEFQRFRETGVLRFQTPMELFDRDFPGHYLRLIKRVRVTVLALTPPSRGIRATLSASGLSRVVVGEGVFQSIIIRRNPEMIAFTSPNNATGLFELEPEGELLLPFEGMGVDTMWELEMPKAANPFDYRSIGDALITVEYTALNSFEYRQQVISELSRSFSGDRLFSLRQQFADQWYELHNPDQSDTPMTVQFETQRDDFLPNVENLQIQQLLLHIAVAEGQEPLTIPVTLRFTAADLDQAVEGTATPIDGTISTRRGSGSALASLIGQPPMGRWELELPDAPEVHSRFEAEAIEDILLVITYQGETPEWPL